MARKSAQAAAEEKDKLNATEILIPLSSIRPSPQNTRTLFDEAKLDELIASIEQVGLLQPIVVRSLPIENGQALQYEIIGGERRYRAFQKMEREKIPAIIRLVQDDGQHALMTLIENLVREDLNEIDKAKGFRNLRDNHGWDNDRIANSIGKSKPLVSNTIRLLDLPPVVQDMIAAGGLSAGHGLSLLPLVGKDDGVLQGIATDIAAKKGSVKELRAQVDEALEKYKLSLNPPLPNTIPDPPPPPPVEPEAVTAPPVETIIPPVEPEPITQESDEGEGGSTQTTEGGTVEPPVTKPSTEPRPAPVAPTRPTPNPSDTITRPASSRGNIQETRAPEPEPAPQPSSEFTQVMLRTTYYETLKQMRVPLGKAVAEYLCFIELLPQDLLTKLEAVATHTGETPENALASMIEKAMADFNVPDPTVFTADPPAQPEVTADPETSQVTPEVVAPENETQEPTE